MSNTRGPGQKLISVPMNEKFIQEIDAALAEMGYSDRSSFIRDAIVEKLHSSGIEVSSVLSLAPSRTGKGGRPPKSYPQSNSSASELKESSSGTWGGKTQAPTKAQKVEPKKKGKYRIAPGNMPQGFGRNYKAQ